KVLSWVRAGKGYSYPVKHKCIISIDEEQVQAIRSLASFVEVKNPEALFIKPIIEKETSEVITESDMDTFIKQSTEVEEVEEVEESPVVEEEEIITEEVEVDGDEENDTDFVQLTKKELAEWLAANGGEELEYKKFKKDSLIAKCVEQEASL
ncbi:hypothetical protein DRO61_09525, partial [Candidatus Bathyarchaeota archaeon]